MMISATPPIRHYHVWELILFILLVGFVMWTAFRKTDDKGDLVIKWILTVAVLLFMLRVVIPTVARQDEAAAYVGIPLAAVSGLLLALIWRRSIAEMIAKPFGSLYDGGDAEIEPKAFYSKAESLRRRGRIRESIDEIRRQLEKFPEDFQGELLLANIDAEDLQDLSSAKNSIQKILNQSGHSPGQIAAALHQLADWQVKLAQDPVAARETLSQIVERFPDTNFAEAAEQRIAHLASVDHMIASHDRPSLAVKQFDSYAHLENEMALREKSPVDDVAARAAACLKQLEKFPLDYEAREKLATIYAEDYRRVAMAADELEHLISRANQPPRQVARWLNLLADWQVKIDNDIDAAQGSIARITEMFPNSALADQAQMRSEYVRLQAKKHETGTAVKFGTYEKDIGLRNT